MELPGQTLGVDEAVDAHSALTGYNGAHPGPGAAHIQAPLLQELVEGFDVLIGEALDHRPRSFRNWSKGSMFS